MNKGVSVVVVVVVVVVVSHKQSVIVHYCINLY